MTLANVANAKTAKLHDDQCDPFKRAYPSLFHWIVNSDMPESELGDQRLANEILSAGSTSTARAHSHIIYHILANPRVRSRLREELQDVTAGWPGKVPSCVELENVPYLQAVLKEGLRDPTVYPSPFTFTPECWLGDINPHMLRNFVPFTRSSRNCLGQNLAQAELSLAIAVLFRPGAPRMELFGTDVGDTDHVHDFVVPLPRLDTKGVRITVQ
ncbi:MAG: hypothetical protein Q9166_006171 [cf. Caloplaca sp. 2 TL-2023]